MRPAMAKLCYAAMNAGKSTTLAVTARIPRSAAMLATLILPDAASSSACGKAKGAG